MSSPWEPAISQAMQRHGGSNRSVPKKPQAKVAQPVENADLPAQPAQGVDPDPQPDQA